MDDLSSWPHASIKFRVLEAVEVYAVPKYCTHSRFLGYNALSVDLEPAASIFIIWEIQGSWNFWNLWKEAASSSETWVTINLLEPEFYIYILAHPVGKMRIIQEPNKVTLWNKRHFEEKKTKIMQHV